MATTAQQIEPTETSSLSGYRRYVERVVRGETVLPTVAEITERFRAAYPGHIESRHDLKSALYLIEALVRTAAVFALTALALRRGLYWALVPLWLVQALNYYAIGAIVHDMAHLSFFRSKTLNRVLGCALSSIILFRFLTLARGHIEHHKYNQSPLDPKNQHDLGAARAMLWAHRTLFVPAPRAIQMLISWAWILIFIFPVLGRNNEFGALRRPSNRGEWLDLCLHLLFWGGAIALLGLRPTLLILFIPVPLSYVLLAAVFLTHIHERSVCPLQYSEDEYELLIFNINNLTMGRTLDRLSFNFARYHVEHHLFPSVPFHKLGPVVEFVHREYGAHVLPTERYGYGFLERGVIARIFELRQFEAGGRQFNSARPLAEA